MYTAASCTTPDPAQIPLPATIAAAASTNGVNGASSVRFTGKAAFNAGEQVSIVLPGLMCTRCALAWILRPTSRLPLKQSNRLYAGGFCVMGDPGFEPGTSSISASAGCCRLSRRSRNYRHGRHFGL